MLVIVGLLKCLFFLSSAQAQVEQTQVTLLRHHKQDVYALAFSPDGRYLASGSLDRTVWVWDVPNQQVLKTFKGHSHWITALAFSPDGQYLISGSVDHTIQRWNLQDDSTLILKGHNKPITSLSCSSDGRYLASGSLDHTIRIWDLNRGQNLAVVPQKQAVAALRFSPNRAVLASALMEQKQIQVWQWQKKQLKPLLQLTGPTAENNTLAFSPDGTYLAAGNLDKNIYVWRADNGALRWTFKGHLASVWSLAYSPDGRYLASGSMGDKTLRFWDTERGREVHHILLKSDKTYSLAYSPDGQLLASGHDDKTIALWASPLKGLKLQTAEDIRKKLPVLAVAGFGLNEPRNGIPEPGDELDVGILLQNKGTAKAVAPRIRVVTALSDITIAPQQWNLPTLYPNQYTLLKLHVKLDPKFNLKRIPFDVQLQADPNASVIREKVTLILHQTAPRLSILQDTVKQQPTFPYPLDMWLWLTDWL